MSKFNIESKNKVISVTIDQKETTPEKKLEKRVFNAGGREITHFVEVVDKNVVEKNVNEKNAKLCNALRDEIPALKEKSDYEILLKIKAKIGSRFAEHLTKFSREELKEVIERDDLANILAK